MKYKRIITIVMDSLGVGALPDAEKYGDSGTDTFAHTAKAVGGLNCPTMEKLGFGNLHSIQGIAPVKQINSYYTKMLEKSVGKDTMTGHWEMMGLYIDRPFQTFTDTGFPEELLKELSEKTGYSIIGNKSASGTEIMDELGERHIKTKEMIVYTSADSVLQICAHEEAFGLDELYRCCEIARDITMKDEWKVGRVIARPFVGSEPGNFKRTSNRHDYALKPYGKTVLDALKDSGYDVISIGKINDIFDGEGITKAYKSKSNVDGMNILLDVMDQSFTGHCFVNLVDFDALWGHRRNPKGYADEIETFDKQLHDVVGKLNQDDLLILTADHGNDPTHTGTDHTREMVPLVMYSPSMLGGGLLSSPETFASLGATIADNFKVKMPEYGKSLLDELK